MESWGIGGICLAFRDFSSLRIHFLAVNCIRLVYAYMTHVKNEVYADFFSV
jgi:hypothetical protein